MAVAANTNLTSLLNATIGSSTSTVSATANTATATGTDTGGQLELLTGLGSGGGPLLTVTVGKAGTTVKLDRTTAQVTASDTPAVVSVTLNSPVSGSQTFPIAPGVSQTFLSGTPLQTTVAAGSGSATPGTGKGSASANGVTIDALQGVGASTATGTNGGVDIQIASSTSTVTGTAPVVTAAAPVTPPAPAPAPAAVPGVTTVHTGEFWAGTLPIVLLGLALLSGLALVARERLSRLAHRAIHLSRFAASSASDLPPGPASGTSSATPPVLGPVRRQSH